MQTLILVLVLQCSTRLATCNLSENELIAKFARVFTSLKNYPVYGSCFGTVYSGRCCVVVGAAHFFIAFLIIVTYFTGVIAVSAQVR